MSTPLFWVLGSGIFFVVSFTILLFEQARGRRIVLQAFRSWLDRIFARIVERVRYAMRYVHRYVIHLAWHHSIQSLVRRVLKWLERVYLYLETKMHHSRTQARTIRSERQAGVSNQLDQIYMHKQETSLTPEQRDQLRREKLERG